MNKNNLSQETIARSHNYFTLFSTNKMLVVGLGCFFIITNKQTWSNIVC